MAKMTCYVLLCALSLKLISAAEVHRNLDEGQNRKKTVSDPVSNFFSELGDLILDVDRTFAVQTAPKVEYEDPLASQIFGPLSSRKRYFNRIQENYRTLQDRLGSPIEETIAPKQAPLDPLNVLLPPTSPGTVKEKVTKTRNGLEMSSQGHEQGGNAEDQVKIAMEKLISDSRRTNEFLGSLGTRAKDEVSSVVVRRDGDISYPTDSDPQGRIIGDVLYSESRFDNYIRQLLRNHGRWVLDNPLLQRWSVSGRTSRYDAAEKTPAEGFHEATEEVTTSSTADITTEALTEAYELFRTESNLPKSGGYFGESLKSLPLMAANYYRVDDDGRILEEKVDIVLQPESRTGDVDQVEIQETNIENQIEDEDEFEPDEPQDTVILAFTPDGIPLKLRMGPEIENPIRYLNKVLRTAGVSLKIPVESYVDLEPVGKEVLVLGAGSGIMTRSVYLDLSNPNELKSLIRALMKTKVSEQKKF